jgi:hypothetical protein
MRVKGQIIISEKRKGFECSKLLCLKINFNVIFLSFLLSEIALNKFIHMINNQFLLIEDCDA